MSNWIKLIPSTHKDLMYVFCIWSTSWICFKMLCYDSVNGRLFRVIKSAESLGTVRGESSSGLCRRYYTKTRALILYNNLFKYINTWHLMVQNEKHFQIIIIPFRKGGGGYRNSRRPSVRPTFRPSVLPSDIFVRSISLKVFE
jgi:hypothetical protein